MELKQVTFAFDDDTKLVLEGKQLIEWMAMCYMKSDYLLPTHAEATLGERFGGIVRGFVT